MSSKTNELPPLLTVEQVAEYLGIAPRRVYRMAESGGMPSIRAGERRVLVPRGKFLEWLGESGPNGDTRARIVAAREYLEAGDTEAADHVLEDLERDLA